MGTEGKHFLNPRIRILTILEYLKENTDKEHPIIKPAIIKDNDIDFYEAFMKSKVTFGKCVYDLADFYSSNKEGYRLNQEEWKVLYDSFCEREIINTPNYVFDENNDCEEIEIDNQIRNLYYNHPFNYDELDQIIMGVHLLGLDKKTSKNIIDRLTKTLASKYYRAIPNSVVNLHYPDNVNRQLLSQNLKLLNDAIGNENTVAKKVSFSFCGYNLDKELTRTNAKDYKIIPIDIVVYTGRYYLFAKRDEYDNVSIWRVDLMKNLQICNEHAKPSQIPIRINNESYYEFLNMFYDKPINIVLKIFPNKYRMDRKKPDYTFLYDYFGKTYTVLSVNNENAKIKVKSSPKAIVNWALQYNDRVEILEPIEVRNLMIDKIKNLNKKYTL